MSTQHRQQLLWRTYKSYVGIAILLKDAKAEGSRAILGVKKNKVISHFSVCLFMSASVLWSNISRSTFWGSFCFCFFRNMSAVFLSNFVLCWHYHWSVPGCFLYLFSSGRWTRTMLLHWRSRRTASGGRSTGELHPRGLRSSLNPCQRRSRHRLATAPETESLVPAFGLRPQGVRRLKITH